MHSASGTCPPRPDLAETPARSIEQPRTFPGEPSWRLWLLPVALCVVVVVVAGHLSDVREFVLMARRIEPRWMLAALGLQVGTYASQAAIWRTIGRRAAAAVPARFALQLSVVELFVDQALPSGGASGTAFAAHVLRQRGYPGAIVAAGVVARVAAYYAAFSLALGAALLLSGPDATASAVPTRAAMVLFCVGSAVIAIAAPLAAGAGFGARFPRLVRARVLRSMIALLDSASPQIAQSPRLLASCTALQLLTMVLDACTMWLLVRVLGADLSPAAVFASFMVASVFRAIGIAPGGLGTFEAASVLTLHAAGASVAVALTATLLFRGLSFWLPLFPGFMLVRRMSRNARRSAPNPQIDGYWTLPADQLIERLATHETTGLSTAEAKRRLLRFGPNSVAETKGASRLRVLATQLKNPLLLLLVFAALTSMGTGELADAAVVLLVVTVSVGVGYTREYRAATATAALRERLHTKVQVRRDGEWRRAPVEELVPGDICSLAAGSLVPADCVLLQASHLYLNQAVLTGESFPVQKQAGAVARSASLAERTNCAFLGTNVRSGTALCAIVNTGRATHFGALAQRLALRPPETDFDRGTRRFGYLLMSAMLFMVLGVFAVHVAQGRPAIETLLFAIALAVGLSPELLPVILNVNLSRGAEALAQRGVLVRRLTALENLGSMDVLCTDKTGTLTEGVVALEGAYDSEGAPSNRVLSLGRLNAELSSGLDNPLDEALQREGSQQARVQKLGEIPFDFVRKRASVLVREGTGARVITKGAFGPVLSVCTSSPSGPLNEGARSKLQRRFDLWSEEGIRVLAVASRPLAESSTPSAKDESELCFEGFLTFLDRPKQDVQTALERLSDRGVNVKMVTGDAAPVAKHVARQVGLEAGRVLTGKQLDELHDEALWHLAERVDIFAEVDPNQKERIILALKKVGHVVGFMGDGVNDAPAMHAADVSLSVQQAVDVAREAADLVLLERSLDVIHDGIVIGRTTLANTMKYILTTTSANLGNMLSMAVASLFLPFLPLLSSQILLNNFLSDIPAVGIASDAVDGEQIARPERWDMHFIGRFMAEFGLLSSLFDLLLFALLGLGFHAAATEFRTAWFVESLLTELSVALVVRTRRRFYTSRPGRVLLKSTIALAAFTLVLPYLPYADFLGFSPLPPVLLATILVITAAYLLATESLKRWFYRRYSAPPQQRADLPLVGAVPHEP